MIQRIVNEWVETVELVLTILNSNSLFEEVLEF